MIKRLVILLALLSPVSTVISGGNTEMIVSVPLETVTLTRAEARNIYLLKTKVWKDGVRITVLRLPSDSPIHREFIRDLLGMSPEQYNAEFSKLVNSGIASTIQVVDTPTEMMQVINRKHNAVGYINKDHLLLNVGGYDVKIINISG